MPEELKAVIALTVKKYLLIGAAILMGCLLIGVGIITVVAGNEEEFKEISSEIEQLNKRIRAIRNTLCDEDTAKRRLALIQSTIDDREKNEGVYDDSIVRQMVECIKVYHDGRIEVIFGGGHSFEESLHEDEEL